LDQATSAAETQNSISAIRAFLTDPEHPFKEGEFVEFWRSLTDEEKAEFMRADLSQ